jgi:polar amino acid transport system substrate-binding protein
MKRRALLSLAAMAGLPAWAFDNGRKAIDISTLVGADPAGDVAEKIMLEAYRRMGIALTVHRQPGERSLVSANSGEMDGELYRKVGMELVYPNLVIVPVPLQTYEIVVFSLGTRFTIAGWDSLRPYSLGFVRGVKIIEQNTTGMRIFPVQTIDQAFQMLSLGRIDVVIGNRRSALAAIKAMKLDGVQMLEPALAAFPVYHYLNKKNAALVPRLGNVLQQMRNEKLIEKIQNSVYGRD